MTVVGKITVKNIVPASCLSLSLLSVWSIISSITSLFLSLSPSFTENVSRFFAGFDFLTFPLKKLFDDRELFLFDFLQRLMDKPMIERERERESEEDRVRREKGRGKKLSDERKPSRGKKSNLKLDPWTMLDTSNCWDVSQWGREKESCCWVRSRERGREK